MIETANPHNALTSMGVSTRVIKSVFVYLEKKYGETTLIKFCKNLPLDYEYLADENNWISWSFYKDFLNKLVEFTNDEDSPFKAGTYAASKECWGNLFYVFTFFNSPKYIFKKALEYNPNFNKSASWEVIELSSNKALLKIKWNDGFITDRNCCINRHGQLASIPTVSSVPPAKVREIQCVCNGADCCIEEYEWIKPSVKHRLWIPLATLIFTIIYFYLLRNNYSIQVDWIILTLFPLSLIVSFLYKFVNPFRLSYNYFEALETTTKKMVNNYDELQKTYSELSKYKDHLEELVSERTKELKDAQAQIVQSEKMASLGMLASGMAHEIMNPINFIQNSAEPLQENVEKLSGTKKFSKKEIKNIQEDSSQLFGIIDEGVDRINKIVRGITTFTRGVSRGLESYNINEAVKSALIMAEHEYKKRIEIKTDLKASREIKCNPGQINQVVLNIFMNAVQAVNERSIPLTPAPLPRGEREKAPIIKIMTWEEDEQVKLSIKDNGPGIKEEHKAKIFDPFFTTKETKPGQNMGLGLSICYNIIDVHQGKIDVNSKENKGTEFIVSLPIQS